MTNLILTVSNWFSDFNHQYNPLVIYKKVRILSQGDSTKHIYHDSIIAAYMRHRHFGEYVVRASKPHAVLTDSPGTFPFDRGRCSTCDFVALGNLMEIQDPIKSFGVKDHFSCVSTDVIYITA